MGPPGRPIADPFPHADQADHSAENATPALGPGEADE